jgi:cholesterol oxidase
MRYNSEDPGYKASGAPALTMHPVGGASIGDVWRSLWARPRPEKSLHRRRLADPGGNVGGVSPAWTIAALAERSMDKIISKDIK